jgi:hypothetical protein
VPLSRDTASLYSLESSLDYDPEPRLSRIKTKLLALNFSDDEFNPTCCSHRNII